MIYNVLTGFNIREENHIHGLILFGSPINNVDVIVILYSVLYAKYYIYLGKKHTIIIEKRIQISTYHT